MGLPPHAPTDAVHSIRWILPRETGCQVPNSGPLDNIGVSTMRFSGASTETCAVDTRHTGRNHERMDTPTKPSSYARLSQMTAFSVLCGHLLLSGVCRTAGVERAA